MANTRIALASSNLDGIGAPGKLREYCRALSLSTQLFHTKLEQKPLLISPNTFNMAYYSRPCAEGVAFCAAVLINVSLNYG
jgi:hypothetical protein